MKHKFRKLVRQNKWHLVSVPRANLWKWQEDHDNWGNEKHYHAIRTWCNDTFPKNTWEGRLTSMSGEKQFIFAQEKYATLFSLKWL